MKLKQWKWS